MKRIALALVPAGYLAVSINPNSPIRFLWSGYR